jgi:hypothetical protein
VCVALIGLYLVNLQPSMVEVDEQVCIHGQSFAVARSAASENKLCDPCEENILPLAV